MYYSLQRSFFWTVFSSFVVVSAVLHFVFGSGACFNQFCTTSVNDTSSSGVFMYPDNASKIYIYLFYK
jgi:hypothetical protein